MQYKNKYPLLYFSYIAYKSDIFKYYPISICYNIFTSDFISICVVYVRKNKISGFDIDTYHRWLLWL